MMPISGDLVIRGDVELTADGKTATTGRWSDTEPAHREGFAVHLERAAHADPPRAKDAAQTPARPTTPTQGLGAAMYLTAARSSTGLGDMLRMGSIEATMGTDRGGGRTLSSSMAAARQQWRPQFEAAAARHGVDAELLLAVAEVESGFDVDAVSSAGAQGLMQFMPATAREMGVDPFQPESAIDGAARYLRRELDRFGRVDLAVAAYNAGAGAVRRHGGVPPYAETQRYVEKVFDAWRPAS